MYLRFSCVGSKQSYLSTETCMLRHLARRSKVKMFRRSNVNFGHPISVTARSTTLRSKGEQQVFTSNEQIVLNLGGTKFTTTQATLQNAPMSSILASLLDEQDTVREDKLDASFNSPAARPNDKFLLELRAEAEYYSLTGLVDIIDRYPCKHSMTTVRRSAYVDTEEELTSDTDLVCDLYFSVDQPCQLLGVGLCGAKQPFTAELALYEVDPSLAQIRPERPWESPRAAKMQNTAQSFTQDDGKIVRVMLPQAARLVPNKCYMLTAAVGLDEQFNCEHGCLDTVVVAGLRMHFHGQTSPEFPELYIRAL